jgi:hypothetical protein
MMQVELLKEQAGLKQALRTKTKLHAPARDLRIFSELIQDLIFSLTNLTNTHSKSFYPAQDEEVTTLLMRAFMRTTRCFY